MERARNTQINSTYKARLNTKAKPITIVQSSQAVKDVFSWEVAATRDGDTGGGTSEGVFVELGCTVAS